MKPFLQAIIDFILMTPFSQRKSLKYISLQGLFSRITFNQPVFIGGTGGTRNVKSFLGVDNGMKACVRHLEINDKLYNLKPSSQGGDIIAGPDISKGPYLIPKNNK